MQRNTVYRTVFIVLLIGMTTTAFAQIQVGILGGMNLSDFKIDQNNPFDADQDDFLRDDVFGGGLLCEYALGNILSLRTQLMVLQKSCSYAHDLDEGYTYKISYLELPLLVKVAIGNTLKPYIILGPSIGYRISAKADVRQGVATGTADLAHITERFDFSGMVGGGISYTLGRWTLFVEGLYVRGFRNINKGGDIDIDIGGFTIMQEVDPLVVKPFGTHIMGGVMIPLTGQN